MDQLDLPFTGRENHQLYFARQFPLLEKKLVECVSWEKSKDPLCPVVIVVPSLILANHLSMKLLFGGINLLNLKQLALNLAGEKLYSRGSREISSFGEELLARRAMENEIKEKDSLYPYIGSPGFRQVFMSLAKDFRQGGFEELSGIRDIISRMEKEEDGLLNPQKLSKVFHLLNSFRRGFGNKYFDVEDAFSKASESCQFFSNIFGTDHLYLYGFHRFDRAQLKLIRAAAKHLKVTAFSPVLPGNETSESILNFFKTTGFKSKEIKPEKKQDVNNLNLVKNLLFSGGKSPGAKGEDGSIVILSCPAPEDEAREITRMILEDARQGYAFEDTAILLKDPSRYSNLVINSLKNAGIPYYNHAGTCPSKTAAGRTVKLLINFPVETFARHQVMEFITSGSVNFENFFEDGYSPVPSRWDQLSREASITRGYNSWIKKLGNLKSDYRQEAKRQKDEKTQESARETINDIDNLIKFIRILKKDLSSFPSTGSWVDYSLKLDEIISCYVIEDENLRQIRKSIVALKSLDNLYSPVDLETFRSFVIQNLETGRIREGRYKKGGVNVFNLTSAIGLNFSRVYVPGMTADKFPVSHEENPLMHDREKEIFNRVFKGPGKLPLRRELASHEPVLFLLMVSSVDNQLVFTFPRLDPSSNVEKIPSPYLPEIGKILTSTDVLYENLDAIPGYRRIAPRIYRNLEPENAIDPGEYREAFLKKDESEGTNFYARELATVRNTFYKSLKYRHERYGKNIFTIYDGQIRDKSLLNELEKFADRFLQSASASSLEEYHTCPYRFFLDRVMKITPLEEPEKIRRITPRHRGTLYHQIFKDFYTKMKARQMLPLQPDKIDQYTEIIKEIAEKAFRQIEESGITGDFSSWHEQTLKIHRSLEKFIPRETESSEFIPSFFERGFGYLALEDTGERESVVIEIEPATTIRFHGRFDRVDLSFDGKRCLVIDYKTGKQKSFQKSGNLAGGKMLQLPLYLFSAGQVIPGIEDIENSAAAYYFATRKGKFKKVEFSGETLKKRETQIKSLLKGIVDGIKSGCFIPYPGEPKSKGSDEGENCSYCDYREICPSDVLELYKRKSNDPSISSFINLKEIE